MAKEDVAVQDSLVRKIWWLASYPKSGNTWLRFLLDAAITCHLDINSPYGPTAFGDMQRWAYQAVCPWPMQCVPRSLLLHLRTAALAQIVASRGGHEIFLKTHNGRCAVEGIQLIPPRLSKGAVYVVRDPRDVAVSWAAHADSPVETGVDFVCTPQMLALSDELVHILGTWNDHVKSWAEGGDTVPTHVLRYEDLHENPFPTFKGVCEFLELDLDPVHITAAIGRCSFDTLQVEEVEKGFRERKGKELFFRQGKVGGWQDVLTPAQAERIQEVSGPMMHKYGYHPEK